MFSRNKKHTMVETLTDLLPKQKKSHTKAKLAGVGAASIAMAAIAGALSKDHDH